MPSNHFEERFPQVAYEADDHNKIITPDSSVFNHERSLISKALGIDDERAHPFYALDNIGRIIRVLETVDRIFISNDNGDTYHLSTCPPKIAQKAYSSIRQTISDIYQGQPGSKGLLWMLNNLDSIQIITNSNNVIKIIFFMKDLSVKEFSMPNENIRSAFKRYMN